MFDYALFFELIELRCYSIILSNNWNNEYFIWCSIASPPLITLSVWGDQCVSKWICNEIRSICVQHEVKVSFGSENSKREKKQQKCKKTQINKRKRTLRHKAWIISSFGGIRFVDTILTVLLLWLNEYFALLPVHSPFLLLTARQSVTKLVTTVLLFALMNLFLVTSST